jgi:hypothetical protein
MLLFTLCLRSYNTGEIIRNPVADKREKLYADMQVTDMFNNLQFAFWLSAKYSSSLHIIALFTESSMRALVVASARIERCTVMQ